MKLNRQHFLILISILLLGLIIRWSVVCNLCGPPVTSYPTMDEMNFRELAGNILDYRIFASWTEGFYTVSTRAPMYPLMIATGYSIAGDRGYSVPKIVNLVFDLCNILLLFLLGRALFGTRLGLVVAGVYAVFGHATYFMAISSPHTFALMLLLLVAIALICIKRSYWFTLPALSIIYALLIHTRPVFLVALPFLFPAIWLQLSSRKILESHDKEQETVDNKHSGINNRNIKSGNYAQNAQINIPDKNALVHKHWIRQNWKKKCIRSLIPVILILLLCLPWGIRNYREHKSIVPVSIVAGWHIASNINYDMKLSIKYLTDQLYAPERRDFKEADYFQAAKGKMFDAFFDNPFKFLFFGLARVVYCWSPPGPFYRFIMPRAYIFPVKVFEGTILPLADFEGFIYLFIAFTAVAFFLLKNKLFQGFSYLFYRMRGITILLLGYALVHIMGIPLIAYRFLIEPFVLIIFLFLIFQYISAIKQQYYEKTDAEKNFTGNRFAKFTIALLLFCDISKNQTELDMKVPVRSNLIVTYSAIILILLAMYIPFHRALKPQHNIYFALLKHKKILTYAELRKMQWNNLGNIDPETRVIVQGVVRYVHQGFKYVEDDYYATEEEGCTAARLFVHYADDKNPLGVGDVRLNIRYSDIPKDGDVIKVIGIAKTGPFKEIILDVNNFE
jgi:hypothetical protein